MAAPLTEESRAARARLYGGDANSARSAQALTSTGENSYKSSYWVVSFRTPPPIAHHLHHLTCTAAGEAKRPRPRAE